MQSRRTSPSFEQFPPQPPYSPPDSDDYSSPPPTSPTSSVAPQPVLAKKSWFGGLFAFSKDKGPDGQEKEPFRSSSYNDPPSPPTSIMSSASSIQTVRPQLQGSNGNSGSYYAIVNPGPNTTLTRTSGRMSANYASSVFTVSSTNSEAGLNNSVNGYKGYNSNNLNAINNINPSNHSNVNNYNKETSARKKDLEKSSPTKLRLSKTEPKLQRADSFSSTKTAGTIDTIAKAGSKVDLTGTIKQEVSTKKSKKDKNLIIYPNMVVPDIEECLQFESKTSGLMSWAGINSLKLPSILKNNEPEEVKPLQIIAPPRIKKAVAIGIHGFFPIRMIRSIIGEPTGTSVKFANEAAAAIGRWAEKHGYDVEIEKIALEGEGIVLDRVENLYRLLMNWISHLYEADFIFVAAHSQGTPVAVQLVAKLIEEGQVDEKRIGIMGMAGISRANVRTRSEVGHQSIYAV